MPVIVVTAPQPLISVPEAKVHLRVEEDDAAEDVYIAALVMAAQGAIDGPTGWLGRAIGEQTLEAIYDTWPCPLRLPCPPLLAIEAASYVDPDGVEQQVPVTNGRIEMGWAPRVRGRPGDVKIRYRAGYEADKIPAPIRHAILLMLSHFFNNRDAVSTTSAQPAELPMGVDRLLSGFRVPRVG